jgi:hypothetical protein
MLGLFGKKSDHPMADIKSAQKLLEDVPKNDALKALQELTGMIQSARDQAEFRLEHQFAVLRLLDEAARPFERKLTREYFAATNNLSTFRENRLWMAPQCAGALSQRRQGRRVDQGHAAADCRARHERRGGQA